MPDPYVSIITATYNRSNVLRHALRSVQRSTFEDYEQIVIGDACTDDTADVVASMRDPRIRFVNLPARCGEQSGPNNEGFRLARGRIIAYLNHDDLWFPDHLETSLRWLAESGADLVFSLFLNHHPRGEHQLGSVSPGGRFVPYVSYSCSTWTLRRELLEEVGPWPSYRDSHIVPSNELLFRAWKRGKEMRQVPRMTVVRFPTDIRPGVYARCEEAENAAVLRGMEEDPEALRVEWLTEIAVGALVEYEAALGVKPHLRQLARKLAKRGLVAAGIRPNALRSFLKYRRKGGFIDDLHRRRGLPAR